MLRLHVSEKAEEHVPHYNIETGTRKVWKIDDYRAENEV